MEDLYGMEEALLYEKVGGGEVDCHLCPQRCRIPQGGRGVCLVRENRDGTLYSLNYGKVSSTAPDPIEKKPLYHFHPGTKVMSFGTVGCNFRCRFCQNYRIARAKPEDVGLKKQSPVEGVELAEKRYCPGVAYTYNEPIVWMEHALEGCREAKGRGLYTVFVTNGYFTEEALELIAPHLDAANVDVKSVDEDFYTDVVSAELAPVLDSCEELYERGVHLELTYLVVPSNNDDEDSFREFAGWVVESLGPEVPVHFSRFHPTYKMRDLPSTPVETLEMAHDASIDEGLDYVYLGNVPGHRYEDTFCPRCGSKLVDRTGFSTSIRGTDDGACGNCGREADIVT